MAIANFYTYDHSGLVAHQRQTGQTYRVSAGGYGIIVIEDTMAPVVGRPLGTFNDGDLVIMMDPVNRVNVAPSHLDPLEATARFRRELLLRPVDLPGVGVQIVVCLPG
jgi:hypothetical protein